MPLADHCLEDEKVPSMVTLNINSMSMTTPGGIADRFFKVLCLTLHLTQRFEVVCLQDTRHPSDSFCKAALSPLFPNYTVHASAGTKEAGGVITILSPTVLKRYKATRSVVSHGGVLCTSLRRREDDMHVLHINNCYLDASRTTNNWTNQVKTLISASTAERSIFLGDFNHVASSQDRTGSHVDRSTAQVALFNKWLSATGLEEIYQPLHTFYRCGNADSLLSSRLDRIYHNFSTRDLSYNYPTACVQTDTPWTTPHTNATEAATRLPELPDADLGIADRQITSWAALKKLTRITDHNPVGVRFAKDVASNNRPRFSEGVFNTAAYRTAFSNLWEHSTEPKSAWAKLSLLKTCIRKAYKLAKRVKVRPDDQLEQDPGGVHDCFKLLFDLEEGATLAQLQEKHSSCADLLDVLESNYTVEAAIAHINQELAFEEYRSAHDQNRDPVHSPSKIELLARSLPTNRSGITSLQDDDNDCITDDRERMNAIATNFWKNKWNRQQVRNPLTLFQHYNKRILTQPREADIALVQLVIGNTGDSAAGPDGLPFQAYRSVATQAAPVFLEALQAMHAGGKPPRDFNSGLLILLPKKPTGRIEDTRPLAINNTDNRILSACLRECITPALESVLSDDQWGFRPGRSVDDNILFFNERFYRSMEEEQIYDILLVDFKKAFDSVAHEAIFALLRHVGFPDATVRAIKSLFHEAHCFTTIDPNNPNRIDFGSGVKQGCPLSPLLFTLVIDVLLDMIRSTTPCDIRCYADDTAIGHHDITPYLPTLDKCFKIFEAHTGLGINLPKTAMVSTGGKTALRTALDDTGWQQVNIVPSYCYLGVLIGREVDTLEIYKAPVTKLMNRLKRYASLKSKYSLTKRVAIWNVWILPVLSFVFKFFIIPPELSSRVEKECAAWVVEANSLKGLHLARPAKLSGLALPLKDLPFTNYSTLIAQKPHPTITPPAHYNSWSMRIVVHRQMALEFALQYNAKAARGAQATRTYATFNNHRFTTNHYKEYILKRMRRFSPGQSVRHHLTSARIIPKWVPDYARACMVKLTHNALFTSGRRGDRATSTCPLCRSDKDTTSHIFGDCPVVKNTISTLQGMEVLPAGNASALLICGLPSLTPPIIGTIYMLVHSIWQARCNADNGDSRDPNSWSAWIITDCLQRSHSLRPHLFLSDIPSARVPARFKVVHSPDFGSSSRKAADPGVANYVVNRMISSLPPGTPFAFTDGSANPNPGPAGAGLAYCRTEQKNGTRTPALAHTAALGLADNNTGELVAIGMALDMFKQQGGRGAFHIFSDSKATIHALTRGWNLGASCAPALAATRSLLANILQGPCSVRFHWVPGHSHIELNELADKAAGAGSKASALPRNANININYSCRGFSFSSLGTLFAQEAPPARAAN